MNISKISEKTIIFLANKLPEEKRESRKEEWLALLEYIPKDLFKLAYSLSFIPAVIKICSPLLFRNLFNSFLFFMKYFADIPIEHFKIVYLTLILSISPIAAILFMTRLIIGFYEKDYSGIFPLLYIMLCILPSLFPIIQKSAYNNLLNQNFNLLEFYSIPLQFLNSWLLAKLASLIGIILFDTNNTSGKLIVMMIIGFYILCWLLSKKYSKHPRNRFYIT